MRGIDSTPLLIAHRGASHDAPENTLAAFRLAWQQGADGIEADFRLSRDGRVVCMHDASTARSGGVGLDVATASLDELRRLDVGAWKGSAWQGERIPTLEEVLAQLPAGKMLFIELKCGPEILAPLLDILRNSAVPPGLLRILSFSAPLIARLKEMEPGLRTCLNATYRWSPLRRGWYPPPQELLDALAECGADGLSSKAHHLLDSAFAKQLHRIGRELHVWTVDSPRLTAKYTRMGANSIITNRPGLLRQCQAATLHEGEGKN